MAGGERIRLELSLGEHAAADLLVRRVAGVEALSAPFRFEVEFVAASGLPLDLAPLPGAAMALGLARPGGAERWVNGVCAAAELVRVESGTPAYVAVLVPRLALLASTRGCRVFQGQSAVEVVKAVLDQHGVAHRVALSGRYPPRDLCIQYRETDLAFVSRLLEEEGIAYWFEHGSDGHTLVLGDGPSAFPALPGGERLPFRREVGAVAGAAVDEHVYALRRGVAVVPGAVALRDHDFERPVLEVSGEAKDGGGLEHYDHPAGTVDPAEARRLARARLERLRFGAETWEGESTCERLAPGAVFEVEGHPEAAFDARLVAVRVEHEGRQETSAGGPGRVEDAYRNRFLAAPAGRAYRPPARTPRAQVRGPQTATVVGPAGEEVHTDRYGRVKVQFHWDREGRHDDTASAWVRLAQSWAGPGMGAVVVPRVGQEVLIRFLEGDPDRPVVTGAVYNGGNPTPVVLPRDRTQSTLRTATSPADGIGHNELRLEDQTGAEQVWLHGQRDEAIEVLSDKDQRVRASETLEVGKDRSRTVNGDQTLRVGAVDSSQVDGSQALRVDGDRTTTVGGSFAETVGGDQTLQVGGTRELLIDATATESVGAAAALTVGGGYALHVALAMNEAVGGARTVEVGAASIETVGAHREETIAGDREAKVGGDSTVDAAGHLHVSVGKGLAEVIGTRTGIEVAGSAAVTSKRHTIEADRFTLLVGGKRILSLERSGRLLLSATSVTVNGEQIALQGASIAKLGPAAAAAAKAKIAKARALRGAPAIAEFTLVDLDGQPMVNQAFELKEPDGTLHQGKTSAEGQVRIPVATRCRYALTIGRIEGDDRTERSPRRGKNARRNARRVERGKPMNLPTNVDHVLELPERVAMTIAFLFEPGRGEEFPKFVLESEDGAYREERTPKDDLVKGDGYLQLRFVGLQSARTYKLTRWLEAGYAQVVFAGRPYAEIVDQPRPEANHLAEARFARSAPRKAKATEVPGSRGGKK